MKLGKTIYLTKRSEWRKWLKNNYSKEKEIWLIFYRKSSGKPRIDYNDAVEEALCYGWIDSIVKSIDNEKFAQRFTPRRNNSILSQLNKERIKKMIKEGKMTQQGLSAVSHVFDKNKKDNFVFPKDIIFELKKDKTVWNNFEKFPESYKKIRIDYINDVRDIDKDMFRRRLNNFVNKTKQNKKFGQGSRY
ncbi:Bacteriocin-protection, YdeI or OmpD-Associated [uncultured archaeon]|nr:Bacteriocin-protection, YdeI or OmpD-Associated [uncultured archaeon]